MPDLNIPTLRLEDHPRRSTEGFEHWLRLLGEEAEEEEWGWLLAGQRLSYRHLRSWTDTIRTEFSAGAEATSAIVQINEPTVAGSENGLAAVAVDGQGRRHLVRQGTLHRNRVSPRIDGDEFRRLTRLVPIAVETSKGPAKRTWFHVARLDDGNAASVARSTADFVDRCWSARLSHVEGGGDEKRLEDLFGGEERGGSMDVVVEAGTRRVRRLQGHVWQRLHDLMDAAGIVMRKPRHADGYEVDAEILAPSGPILLEIKTTTTPADVFAGVGQLAVYPALLPRLADHRRVLLVAGDCRSAFAQAVRKTGVELHGYDLRVQDDDVEVSFHADFLVACGVQPSTGRGGRRAGSDR